jgi:hypothetical protein
LVEVTLAGYDQVKAGEKDPRNEPREGVTEVTKDPQRQTKLPVEDDKGVTDELRDVELGKETLFTDDKTDIAAGLDSLSQSKGLKPIPPERATVIDMGKIRNEDGELVDEENDPEFLAGLEKGYGNA